MAAKLTSAFNRADDLRLQPAYTVAEAAHYVRMPEVTLRSWVSGRLYPVSGQQRRSSPVIHLDDPKGQYLSFINLVEAHVLGAIRRGTGSSFPRFGEHWTTSDANFTWSARSLTRRFKPTDWIFS
jgi:hypothetical protein